MLKKQNRLVSMTLLLTILAVMFVASTPVQAQLERLPVQSPTFERRLNPAADLSVDSIRLNKVITEGDRVGESTFNISIKNSDTTDVPAFKVTLSVTALSGGPAPAGVSGTRDSGPLAKAASFAFTWPNAAFLTWKAGSYRLTIEADSGKIINDSNRQNNLKTFDFTVQPIRPLTAAVGTGAATSATGCTESPSFSGGNVTADRILSKACSPYTIKNDINVTGNATLTIERGATIRFNPNTKLLVGYNGAAKLVAVGTASEPIVLTSANSSPGAGDWVGIQLLGNTMNGTIFSYLKLDYCGSYGGACLYGQDVKPNRVTVDHVTFAHVGAGSNGITQKSIDSNFMISNCSFFNIPTSPSLQFAISAYAPSFAGIDSTNAFNGSMVELKGGTVSYNAVWKNIGAVIAVTGDIKIEGVATPTATVAAGSVFRFARDIGISVGYSSPGRLVLAGTATSRISLMSLTANPSPGDWSGINVENNSAANINFANISHAGSAMNSAKGAVSANFNSTNLSIQNSSISFSGGYGIGVPCSSTATIVNTGNTFSSNAKGDIGPGPNGPNCK
jgi:hypothetical protein